MKRSFASRRRRAPRRARLRRSGSAPGYWRRERQEFAAGLKALFWLFLCALVIGACGECALRQAVPRSTPPAARSHR